MPLTFPVDNLLLERELVQVCTPGGRGSRIPMSVLLGSETKAHKGCRKTLNSSRDNQTRSLYGRELMAEEKD